MKRPAFRPNGVTSLIAFLDHQPVQELRPFVLAAAKIDRSRKPPKTRDRHR
jgi:hypothetical protein